MSDKDLDTINAMEKYGGSFAAALAKAARVADATNLMYIKTTWANLWARYEEMATHE